MENKAMKIRPVSGNKKQFLDLLLLGDEQESMIDRYLEQGELFALYDGDLKSVCVVIAIDDSVCELKNIATYEQYQGQGYGNALINYLFDYYKDKYKMMLVGTGDVPSALSFYKRCGFELSHRIKNFFTDNYDHPMFEEGVQLIDMVYLKKNLSANKEFSARQATVSDIPTLRELYKNTVLSINRKDYSAEEVEDWASYGDDLGHWDELFAEQHYIVAENNKGQIVGFASINNIGYMHTLFVHKDFQHQGIATLLFQTLEKYAKEKGADKITSEISITARPFFEKQGFVVDEEQKRKANKLFLTNYKMSKTILKYKITDTSKSEYPDLMKVWEASVRATHHFLKEEDILFFRKVIPEKYLDAVKLFVVRDAENAIHGFLGVSDDAIEMLFIHPDARGKGIGSILLGYAVNELHLYKVDVNEQNQQAVGFYLHKGFSIVGRSELDGTGKPYPILLLKILKR